MIVAAVVTYSAPGPVVDACIASLRRSGGVDHVVVVDTGGRARPSDPDVELVRTANRGYGAAANLAIELALARGATAVAVLNDDVVVDPGWLPPLVAALAGAGVGAVQPALLETDPDGGADAPRRVSSLGVAIGRDGAGVDIGRGEPHVPSAAPRPIEMFTGGAVLLDPEFLVRTGGFDERWFLYYEDVDLARRGRHLGWHYLVVPASSVVHAGGASTSGDPERTRYLQERNRIWAAVRFADPATVVRAVWLSVRRLRHPPRSTHARALATGLLGAPRWWLRRVTGHDDVGFVSGPDRPR